MSLVYATVNGRLVQENRGGVVTRYVADTLGSVIQTRDDAGNQTSTTTYWPFGEMRASSSPWGFCGTWGYYKDAVARFYVKARIYRPREARWNTLDSLYPDKRAYAYADGDPVGRADPSGRQAGPLLTCLQCAAQTVGPAIEKAKRFCKENGIGGNAGSSVCNAMQHCMWSCLIAQKCHPTGFQWWECTKLVTDSHKKDGPFPPYRTNPGPNPPDKKCMDLYNNRIGINCASASSCYLCCSANIKSGNCQFIDPSPGYPPKGWRRCRTGCKPNPSKVILPPILY